MDENERASLDRDRRAEPRIERETTVIQTGERRGGGGLIAAIILLLALVVLLFLFFGSYFEGAADEVGVNVNVEAPDVQLPEVDVPEVDVPEVDVPEVDIDVAPPSEDNKE